MRIFVPKGTKGGAYVDPGSANTGELEFLFRPGMKVRIDYIKRKKVYGGVEITEIHGTLLE